MPGHLHLVPNDQLVVTDEQLSIPAGLTLRRDGWRKSPLGHLTNRGPDAELVLRPLPHGHFQLVATAAGDGQTSLGALRVTDTVALLDGLQRTWALEETRQTAAHLTHVAHSALARGEGLDSQQAEQIALRLERAAELMREIAELGPEPAPLAA